MLFRHIRPIVAGIVAVALLLFSSPVRHTVRVHADGVTVSMINNIFTPIQITVPAGTTVTWTNNEDPNGTDVIHDVMADDYTSWSSDYINPGASFSYTFSAPGTYHYLCDLHTSMEGTVVVQ